MYILTDTDANGDMVCIDKQILTTDLKKMAGFGKDGEKNFPGITTELMMKLYLVTADFHRRKNKRAMNTEWLFPYYCRRKLYGATMQSLLHMSKNRHSHGKEFVME